VTPEAAVLTRRRVLAGLAAAAAPACGRAASGPPPVVVNDVHSRLNPTPVARVVPVATTGQAADAVRAARRAGQAVAIAGGRHAMGGQQFARGAVLLDTRPLDRVLAFDRARGLVEVEAGIQWPALVAWLAGAQRGAPGAWAIRQKQTGADRLCLGGAVSANVHGRGLAFPPFVDDVEGFVLVGPDGEARAVSRREHPELFALAAGGYGLLGVVTSVTVRLAPRRKLRRVVEVLDVEDLPAAFARRRAEGFAYGDFQYATDPAGDGFLRRGVFSCYQPVDDATPMPETVRELSLDDWGRLLYLSHADKRRAFEEYAAYYLATSGQLYWSDTHQLSVYVDDYHAALDRRLQAQERATEMISELYVPRDALVRFLADVREDLRRHRVELIYGTIRLIERDAETLLAWAREPWACVIVNLHVEHTARGLARAAADFQRLIDHALRYGGSYFLTYHRWARRDQVEAAHPRLREFLAAKRRHDPDERFQSDWYRHHRALLGAGSGAWRAASGRRVPGL
jgi:FAD/FMN-containing dehydrogenase